MLLIQKAAERKDLDNLWKEYKEEGSTEAKDTITVHYLGLVRIVAGRIAMNAPPHVEKDDLIGWGALGLIDAVERFDTGYNVTFETYASTRIRGAIVDHIRSLDWAPRSLRHKARQMNRASEALKDNLGREPTEAELAKEMGVSRTDLFELTTEIHGAYILSLDAETSTDPDGGETTLGDITRDETTPSPEDLAVRKEAEERLSKAIEGLPETERNVLTLYYFDELTLKEIGEVLGLSESRICQIHRAVIRKLKHKL
jgi:RNA polymerase sigma factor for flagellar operon FliA